LKLPLRRGFSSPARKDKLNWRHADGLDLLREIARLEAKILL